MAQLNGALTNLPNLRLFLDTIHLQEAKASSEIENIITTNDELYKSVVGDKKLDHPAAKEIISYKEALWAALGKLEKKPFITTHLCIEIVQKIKQNNLGIRETHGTVLSNAKGDIIYTPPSGKSVIKKKLANLEKFINEKSELDPLVKLALLHYQFEAIHPFADGNGRTGRILLLLYLKLENLLDIPAIFLSEYIMKNKAEYYHLIREVTEKGNWENWILYMLAMVEWTAKKGLNRLQKIVEAMEEISEEIRQKAPKAHSKDLVEILFKLPYTKRNHLIEAGLGTAKTVGNYLNNLGKSGYIEIHQSGQRKAVPQPKVDGYFGRWGINQMASKK